MRIAYNNESSAKIKTFPLLKYDLFNATSETIEKYISKDTFKQLLQTPTDYIIHLTIAGLTYNVSCYNIYEVTKQASDTHLPNANVGDRMKVIDLSIDSFVQRADLNIYYNMTQDRFEVVFPRLANKEVGIYMGWGILECANGSAVNEAAFAKSEFKKLHSILRNTADNLNISFNVGFGRCNPLFIYAVIEGNWHKVQFIAATPTGDGTNFIGIHGLSYYEIKLDTATDTFAPIVRKPLLEIMSQAQYDALPNKDPRVTYYTTN